MMSARLGDILSELFFLSAVLKRWHDEGHRHDDLPLVEYAMAKGLAHIEKSIHGVLQNLANRPLAWLLTIPVQPLGVRRLGPTDAMTQRCADMLLQPGHQRDRITAGLFLAPGNRGANGIAELEQAFEQVVATEPLQQKIKKAGSENLEQAVKDGVITEAEREQLQLTAALVSKVVAVDDFAQDELHRL